MGTSAERRIVVIGGTSAIAQHTLRVWLAQRAADVHLVGRDQERLASVASDLGVRFPASGFTWESVDLTDVGTIDRAVAGVMTAGAPDVVLIAHGSLGSQAESERSLSSAFEQLTVTGVSPALWLEAFADRMTSGTLAVVGSVAGDRGRRSNYLYGAGKALIEHVVQGLQHRFAGTDVHVVLVKPGPTRTPMTAGLEAAGARLADVRMVAACIARAIDRNRRVTYAPARWRPIMAVVRRIPSPLFDRLDL